MKLKIALNLQADDILEMLQLADFKISKHELSAFFRKADHKHYRKCQDQVLRHFLKGLQFKHRGTMAAAEELTAVPQAESAEPQAEPAEPVAQTAAPGRTTTKSVYGGKSAARKTAASPRHAATDKKPAKAEQPPAAAESVWRRKKP